MSSALKLILDTRAAAAAATAHAGNGAIKLTLSSDEIPQRRCAIIIPFDSLSLSLVKFHFISIHPSINLVIHSKLSLIIFRSKWWALELRLITINNRPWPTKSASFFFTTRRYLVSFFELQVRLVSKNYWKLEFFPRVSGCCNDPGSFELARFAVSTLSWWK